jgi:hypothetical protein
MSPDYEDHPELHRVRKLLEAAEEIASHMEVKGSVPDPGQARDVRQAEEIRRRVEEALGELASFRHGEHAVTRIVNALEQSTTTIVGAMATNANQIGTVLSNQNQTAFEADPAVLAEGEFLKAQLTGVEGTEGRGPLLKDASIAVPASGFEVLADAVETTSGDSYPPTQ